MKIAVDKEVLLLCIAGIFFIVFEWKLPIYIVFFVFFISNILKKSTSTYRIVQIVMFSLILPDNYTVIFVCFILLIIINFKNKRNFICVSKQTVAGIYLFTYLVINLIVNAVPIGNVILSVFYLSSTFLGIYLFGMIRKNINFMYDFVVVCKQIIVIEAITSIARIVKLNTRILEMKDLDWFYGTFGDGQGVQLFQVMIYISLGLLIYALQTNNSKEIIWIILAALIALLTGSTALTCIFFFSVLLYFICSKINMRRKVLTLLVAGVLFSTFYLASNDWVKNDLKQLPKTILTKVDKINLYRDVFFEIIPNDKSFFFVGSGIGTFNSRASLTATGFYNENAGKYFDKSTSLYCSKYVLHRWLRVYNSNALYGTAMMPTSELIVIIAELGIIGIICIAIYLFQILKNKKQYTYLVLLTFIAMCAYENLLEFPKTSVIFFIVFNFTMCNQADIECSKRT